QTGDLTRAERVLAECLASFPQSVYTGVAYTEILRKQGKFEQAREQWKTMFALHGYLAQSWELPIRMKIEDAAAEAGRRQLIPPDKLYPVLARGLVIARSAHYLGAH